MVSIITPTYNAAEYVALMIESVQSQSYSQYEHLIIDDCSSDNTLEIVQQYINKDNRIKLIRLKQNEGAGFARNKGIEEAINRYIAFLDSDDIWHPEKLEKQIKFMTSNNYAFTFTSYDQIDEDGKKKNKNVYTKERVTYKKALFDNPIGCLTVMYDSLLLGKQYMPTIRKRQDYALWLKILKTTDGFGLNEILSSYRVRKNSISSNKLYLIKHQWRLYRTIEGFSVVKSMFYLFLIIINKIIK